MTLPELIIELTVDLIAVGLGVFLMLSPSENYLRFYWGLIVALIGLTFAWENIGWISIVRHNSLYEFSDILSIEKMLKWYFLASIVAIFPTASLRPGYLNHNKVTVFLLPTIIVTTIGLSYLCFNGNVTQIDSTKQLFQHIGNADVKLRLVIFLCSVFIPLLYFIYPIVNQGIYRRINHRMYLFFGFMFLLLFIYIFFTLSINMIFFNAFGIASVVFCIFFSVLYLRYENPFSIRIETVSEQGSPVEQDSDRKNKQEITPQSISQQYVLPIFHEIEHYLMKHRPYIKSDYTLLKLSQSLGVDKSPISAAVKSRGYTNFKEYINHLRLENFKQLAAHNPEQRIKELMFNSGFTSRTTFYRIFKEQYGISPSEFIDNQLRQEVSMLLSQNPIFKIDSGSLKK